jgi:hypothetical protein
MKRKSHYRVIHTQIKTFTASSGAQQVSIDNAFLGSIPKRILIAIVKNAAFVGFASTNPFHFHHYDDKFCAACKWSSVPFRATYNGLLFALWSYQSLRKTILITGMHHNDRADMITLEMFTKGFYVLGFDLTPD